MEPRDLSILDDRLKTMEQKIALLLKPEVRPSIVAKYSTDAGQSILSQTSPATILDYEDQIYDTHSLVTTGAAWKFTAQSTGYYAVTGAVMFESTTTWAATELCMLMAFKNGSAAGYLQYRNDIVSGGSLIFVHLVGSTVVQLDATDYLDLRVLQNSGGALAIYSATGASSYNHVSIWGLH